VITILVVNGPNLGTLGGRQPEIYGVMTLSEINTHLAGRAEELGWKVECFQSNSEGAIIDFLEERAPQAHGLVLNPGSLAHNGLALRDALAALAIPVVEVHLTNIHAREEWRRRSVTAEVARGMVSGFGWRSYLLGLEALSGLMEPSR
jgi:3-dehydroquinate dehydratase-2